MLGIKKAPLTRIAATTGAAMQKYDGLSIGAATLLVIKRMHGADLELPIGIRGDVRIQVTGSC